MKKTTFFGLAALAIALMPACSEKWGLDEADKQMELDMGIAMPIAHITATVDSFLPQRDKDWVFDSDSTGTVYLNFQSETESEYNDNLEHSGTYQGPTVTMVVPAGTQQTMPFQLHLGNINRKTSIKVNHAVMKDCEIAVTLTGLSASNINRVSMVTSALSEDATSKSYQMANRGNGKYSYTAKHQYVKLSKAHEFDLTLLIEPGEPLAVATEVTLVPTIKVDGYDVLYGIIEPDEAVNMKHKEVKISELLDKNTALDSMLLAFKNPQVKITMASNVGGPLQFDIKNIKATTVKGKTVQAEFPDGTNTYSFTTENYPDPANPNAVGDTAYNYRWFTKTNGHTERLFQFSMGDRPDVFTYDFNAQVPDWFIAQNIDMFVTEYPFYDLNLDVMLPLAFDSLHAIYRDTIDVDIDGQEDWVKRLEDLDWATLYLTGQNGLPAQVGVDVKYLDAAGQEIVFNETVKHILLDAPAIDADGKVIKSQVKNFTPIQLSVKADKGTTEFKKLKDIKKIAFRLEVVTPSFKSHFMKTDDLKLNVALKGHGKYIYNEEDDK